MEGGGLSSGFLFTAPLGTGLPAEGGAGPRMRGKHLSGGQGGEARKGKGREAGDGARRGRHSPKGLATEC